MVYAALSTEELIKLCVQRSDISAWEEFAARFRRPIAMAVLRVASSYGCTARSTIDDLVQETYLKLCAGDFRIMRSFEHRHAEAFSAFLKVMASNTARDHFRSLLTARHGSALTDSLASDNDIASRDQSSGSAEAMERQVLIAQISQHLDVCVTGPDRKRDLQIFWLYYRAGLSARAISELPGMGLSPKGVESLVQRVIRSLRQHVGSPAAKPTNFHSNEGILPSTSL